MKPAARLTDMHTCPMVTPGLPPIPHVGGPIMPPCYPPVIIGNMPAARVSDLCMCVGPPDVIVQGSPTVFIGMMPAARIGDLTAHGGVIVTGWPTVLIGDSGGGPPGGPGMPGMPKVPGLSPGQDATVTEDSHDDKASEDAASKAAKGHGGGGPQVNKPFKSGLGDKIDAIINLSPTLVARMKKLKGKVDIEYGPKGGGTYYDPDAKPRPKIVVDPNDSDTPALVVQSLSHETGHALYKMDPYVPPDGLTKDEYVSRNVNRDLKNEGEATMANAEVRDEILKNGGPDIGIAGTHQQEYEDIYKKYPDPKDRDKARQEIADIYKDGEQPSGDENKDKTYGQYYAEPYEKTYDDLQKKKQKK